MNFLNFRQSAGYNSLCQVAPVNCMEHNEKKFLEELESLKRVTNGILAAGVIHAERYSKIIGRIEPVFKTALDLLARDIGLLEGFVPDLSQGGFGQTYDLLFRYQSIIVSLRTLDKGYLVLLISSRAELPTIRSFSTLTVRNLNKIMGEDVNV
jgi:hypothetical protein